MSGAVIVVGLVMGCSTSEPSSVREALTVEEEASPPAEASESEPASEPACTACLSEPLGLIGAGGMPCYHSTGSISGCGVVNHEIFEHLDGPLSETCTASVRCDGSKSGMAALVAALADPDVEAAVAAGDHVYGVDMRGVDGVLMELVWKGTKIGLSFPMVEDAEHPIPKGLKTLGQWFEAPGHSPFACTSAAPSGG